MSLRLPGGPVAANHGNSGAAFALYMVHNFCIHAAAALATFSHSLRSSHALCPGIPGFMNLS